MNVILCGAGGRMGRELANEVARCNDMQIVAAADRNPIDANCACYTNCAVYTSISDVRESADVVVDFSHHTATKELADFAVDRGLPLVVATTGQTEEERMYIAKAAQSVPVFFCGNMSLGVTLFVDMSVRFAKTFPYADVEIIETHHKGKADSPSGTALMIANAVREARGKDCRG